MTADKIATLLTIASWVIGVIALIIPYMKPVHIVDSNGKSKITLSGSLFLILSLGVMVLTKCAGDYSDEATKTEIKDFSSKLQSESNSKIAKSKDSIITALASQYRLYYDLSTQSFKLNAEKTSRELKNVSFKSKPDPFLSIAVVPDTVSNKCILILKATESGIESIDCVLDKVARLKDDELIFQKTLKLRSSELAVNDYIVNKTTFSSRVSKIYFLCIGTYKSKAGKVFPIKSFLYYNILTKDYGDPTPKESEWIMGFIKKNQEEK